MTLPRSGRGRARNRRPETVVKNVTRRGGLTAAARFGTSNLRKRLLTCFWAVAVAMPSDRPISLSAAPLAMSMSTSCWRGVSGETFVVGRERSLRITVDSTRREKAGSPRRAPRIARRRASGHDGLLTRSGGRAPYREGTGALHLPRTAHKCVTRGLGPRRPLEFQ